MTANVARFVKFREQTPIPRLEVNSGITEFREPCTIDVY